MLCCNISELMLADSSSLPSVLLVRGNGAGPLIRFRATSPLEMLNLLVVCRGECSCSSKYIVRRRTQVLVLLPLPSSPDVGGVSQRSMGFDGAPSPIGATSAPVALGKTCDGDSGEEEREAPVLDFDCFLLAAQRGEEW